MPHDRKMGEACCQRLTHLMSFLNSKEIKLKGRQLLFEYIDEQLMQMQNFPFVYAPEILWSLAEHLDHYGEVLFRKERKQALDQSVHEYTGRLRALFILTGNRSH